MPIQSMNVRALAITAATLFTLHTTVLSQETLENHFDVVQKFSTIQSKSRQLVLMSNKSLKGQDLDSAKLIYMELKSSSDGVIARYKSIIDNPSLAKKNGESIKDNLNEVSGHLNNFTRFYAENANTGMGFNPIAGLSAMLTISDLGKGVYTEIKGWQKTKRDETKAEIDQYKLLDWDQVK